MHITYPTLSTLRTEGRTADLATRAEETNRRIACILAFAVAQIEREDLTLHSMSPWGDLGDIRDILRGDLMPSFDRKAQDALRDWAQDRARNVWPELAACAEPVPMAAE